MMSIRILPWILAFTLTGCITAKDEEQGDALREVGLAQLSEGDPTGALGTLMQARELDPKNADTHHQLGMAYFAKNLYVDAEACMLKALKYNPELSEARLNLSSVYIANGRSEDAINVLQDAVTDPLYRRTHRAYNNLGVAYEQAGELDEARRAFARSVQLSPNFCLANFNLARIEDTQGELAQAGRHYAVAIKHCPNEARYELEYGWTLARLGQPEEARYHLNHVAQLKEMDALAQKAREYLRVME